MTAKEYEAARTDFEQAIVLEADYAEAYVGRGTAYFEVGKTSEAYTDFNKAIELAPTLATAYEGRGRWYLYSRLGQQSRDDLSKAIELDDRLYDAHVFRSSLAGDEVVALADLDRAIQLQPERAEAYYRRGQRLTYADKTSDAITDFDSAIRFDPNMVDAFVWRGKARRYHTLGLNDKVQERAIYREAVADFDQAIKLDPNEAEAYLERGRAYASLQDKEKAVADFEAVVRTEQGNSSLKQEAEQQLYWLRGANSDLSSSSR